MSDTVSSAQLEQALSDLESRLRPLISQLQGASVAGAAVSSGAGAGDITTSSSAFVAVTGGPSLTVPHDGPAVVTLSLALVQSQAAGVNNMVAHLAVNGRDSGIGVTRVATVALDGTSLELSSVLTLREGDVLSVVVRSANSISSRFAGASLMLRGAGPT
jgi:hypothetical protein